MPAPPVSAPGTRSLNKFDIGARTIRPKDVVILVLASANRDPRAIPGPDRFDIDRKDPRHLSFGRGRHSCIGGTLVAKEFQIALRAIFDGSRSISLGDRDITWTARMGHRWPEALHLTFDPPA